MKELEKTYDPSQIEDRLYRKWEEKKYFHAEVDRSKKPFTIVMPPPNVTGQLHMGHALDNTMQDILIRFKRMQGYSALWQPGTDHAAIATEVKVTEKLKEQRQDYRKLLLVETTGKHLSGSHWSSGSSIEIHISESQLKTIFNNAMSSCV